MRLIDADTLMNDIKNDAEKAINEGDNAGSFWLGYIAGLVSIQPTAQPEICEGCKHLGKWENEVEYGYPSPCTRCKRRVEDYYER